MRATGLIGRVATIGLGAVLLTGIAQWSAAQDAGPSISELRGPAPLAEESTPPRIPKIEETDQRQVRNYPEQPPIIPHSIDGYQVDKNGNKCLSCHARSRVGESGAPMISITHFMDRDGQFLAAVSPRRYFCNQCHVPQTMAAAPLGNDFVDVDTLLSADQKNKQ